MRTRYRNIARVARAHGMKGEVVAVPLRGFPSLLEPGMRVCLTPPALDRERWSTVEEVVPFRDGGDLVRFSCAHDLSAAESLAGCTVLAEAEGLDLSELDFAEDELVGREVEDVRLGSLGTVTDVLFSPAHDILVVEGVHGEVMVPVVDEFVLDVPETGAIQVSVPSGLLDL